MVIQITDCKLDVSERHWEADEDGQTAQQVLNDENMRASLEELERVFDAPELRKREKRLPPQISRPVARRIITFRQIVP